MTSLPKFFFNIFKITAYTFTAVLSLVGSLALVLVILIAAVVGLAASGDEYSDTEIRLKHHAGDQAAADKLVSIAISGLILGEREELPAYYELFSETGITYGYDIKETLYQLAEKDDVDGIILEIHSPGGTIYGTTAITDGVEHFRQTTGKPVVAYIGSTAASGAYWIAASADEVVADNGTAIGSIGVIAGPFKFYDGVISEDGGAFGSGVTTQNGIETEYITAGRSKDLGNPYRPLTEEEKAILQQSVDNSYNKFISYISQRRGIAEEALREQLGALIYDEVQAKERSLIDSISSREAAYGLLAILSGVSEFEVLRPETPVGFWSSFSAVLSGDFSNNKAAPSFCSDRMAVLAFSGDISALCSKN